MVGFLELTELNDNFNRCREYTRVHARTFYFASHVLPRRKRYASYALYAFCRYADNIVDGALVTGGVNGSLLRLDALRAQLRYAYAYSQLMDPKLIAFRETVRDFGIPIEYFLDLLKGVELDLTKNRYTTFDELHDYCYCVASVVGLMMSRVFGVSDKDALSCAAHLGTAMQLTNILRDVGEDYRMGRIYLPEEDSLRFGVSEEDIQDGTLDERGVALLQYQIARARKYYRLAAPGILRLPDDGSRFCVRLMSQTYENILNVIERNGYNVFSRRAVVPFRKKALIAARTLLPVSRNAGAGINEPSKSTVSPERSGISSTLFVHSEAHS